MDRETPELPIGQDSEEEPENAHSDSEEEERVPIQPAHERHGVKVGQGEIRLAAPVFRTLLSERRGSQHRKRPYDEQRRDPRREWIPSDDASQQRHVYLTSSLSCPWGWPPG